jgi:hypothetical protein
MKSLKQKLIQHFNVGITGKPKFIKHFLKNFNQHHLATSIGENIFTWKRQ